MCGERTDTLFSRDSNIWEIIKTAITKYNRTRTSNKPLHLQQSFITFDFFEVIVEILSSLVFFVGPQMASVDELEGLTSIARSARNVEIG